VTDLARFMFPYWWIPKRWVSTLFEHNAGRPTKTVCSVMMAEAFASVQFPIRPVLHQDENGNLKMYRRNSRLITPSDFDVSPYFDVIKYPILDLDDLAVYRKLPWDRTGVHCNDIGDCFVIDKSNIELITTGETETESATPDSDNTGTTEADEPESTEDEAVGEAHKFKQQHNH
jgi:hypothetical protein